MDPMYLHVFLMLAYLKYKINKQLLAFSHSSCVTYEEVKLGLQNKTNL